MIHITDTLHCYQKTICSCTLSTSYNDNLTVLNQSYIVIKKAIHSCFYWALLPMKHNSNKQPWEVHSMKQTWNMKTSQLSIHIIYSYILVVIAQKHFTASTMGCLKK